MPTLPTTTALGEPILTVGQLSLCVKETLEELFPSVWVTGELSNVRRPGSGHIYLDLKDESAVLHSVIWRSAAHRLRFDLEDGQQVLCQGSVDVYPPHGKYQLVIRRIEPVGEGALQLAFRQLHDRLGAEGLFDPQHKQPLPKYPRRIAVITSPTGAAIRDFLNIAARRWPAAEILIIPARVQGDGAAGEIARGIEQANGLSHPPDLAVVTRGGGSLEDLWSFNEELVARAIFASQIPVVSAVGHEVDVTLADLVADLRAPTPTAAAELSLPDEAELRLRIEQLQSRLSSRLVQRARQARERLDAIARNRVLRRPLDGLRDHAQHLDDLQQRGTAAIGRQHHDWQAALAALAGRLESLSPLGVLQRGYSLTTRKADGQVVRDTADVDSGDLIETRLAHGTLVSRVEGTQAEN